MPSPAMPARTAHSRPFCWSQIHAPRMATSEHKLLAGCDQVRHRHASRLMNIISHAVIVFRSPRLVLQVRHLLLCSLHASDEASHAQHREGGI